MKKSSVTMLMLDLVEEGLSTYGLDADTPDDMREHAQNVVHDILCLIPPLKMMKGEILAKPLVKLLVLFVLKPQYMGDALNTLEDAMDKVLKGSIGKLLEDALKCASCEDKEGCEELIDKLR